MRFGQDPTNTPDYQTIITQLSEGQHRLAYLEAQMKKYKILMVVLTILSLIVVTLNKGCKKDERKTK